MAEVSVNTMHEGPNYDVITEDMMISTYICLTFSTSLDSWYVMLRGPDS